MNFLKKTKKQRAEADRQRRRGTKRDTTLKAAFSRDAFVSFLLFLAFGTAATLFAFLGLSSAGPLVQKDQVSRIRITAEIPFTYTSEIETNRLLQAVQQKVPPVFLLDLSPYRDFRSYMESLVSDIGLFAEVPENTPEELARLEEVEIQEFLRDYDSGNPYNLRPSDLATLFNQLGIERS